MLERFCCFRLNTAGMVIGWLGAAASVLYIIVFGVCLGNIDDIVNFIADKNSSKDFDVNALRTVLIVVFVVYLTIAAINLVASLLLVVGTVKERHLLLLPWLINASISFIFSALYFVALVVGLISSSAPFGSVIQAVFFVGLGLALQYYVLYAVYSLYKQIQRNSDQQQQLLQTRTAGASYPSYTKI